jgi:hypothetical protein
MRRNLPKMERRQRAAGLYKFWFKTVRGTGCGVMFATPDGKLYGGNSGSSFIGSYTESDGVVSSELRKASHKVERTFQEPRSGKRDMPHRARLRYPILATDRFMRLEPSH